MQAVIVSLAVGLTALSAFLLYVWIRYSSIIRRIFEEPPVFAPLRGGPEPGGEDVRLTTADGLELVGTYLRTLAPSRLGVVVFCPEYLGDRWSALTYANGLREAGFDLFTFDFRNHADSQSDPTYSPLQWVSDREVTDLRAVLDYLETRPDRDPAGIALFGLSRGGGTALVLAASSPRVWGLITDGAFPTRGTMMAYIHRWAEIYVGSPLIWRRMPRWMFAFAGWTGRVSSQWRSGRSYPSLERAAARLGPRPWLLIHGEKDVYIGPEIALELFQYASGPKQSWVVPGAKHNRCCEADPAEYRDRIVAFLREWAPRTEIVRASTVPAPRISEQPQSQEAVLASPAVP